MRRRPFSRVHMVLAVAALTAALAGTAVATAGADGTGSTARNDRTGTSQRALPLPTPAQFAANLDLECWRTNEYIPPPPPSGVITLSHLNPEMAQAARWQINRLGPRTQLCSPVAKGTNMPPAGVREWVQEIDHACYTIQGPSLEMNVTLQHINPLLAPLPRKEVRVLTPETLCVPVLKNDQQPPPEVLEMAKYLDFVCYRETPMVPMNRELRLTQLNRELAHIPPTIVQVNENRQLCVPVRKDNQPIPDRYLRIIQMVDFEKYRITAPQAPVTTLRLRHINPLFQDLPVETAVLQARVALELPVAKNGNLPPNT